MTDTQNATATDTQPKPKDDRPRLPIVIEHAMNADLSLLAAREDVSRSEIVRRALTEYVAAHK